jgi:hypothetical protein
MAVAANLPSETEDAFELPSTDDKVMQKSKEVSWSATPKEIDQETIEKRKMPIQYQIADHLSVKTVLKETHTMFKATDKAFDSVSKVDLTFIIKTAKDFNRFSADDWKKLFPAQLINGKAILKLFAVSSMSISRLKRSTFGDYKYSAQTIWIMDDLFESTDARNIGFIIRKDPWKVSRNHFTASLTEIFSTIDFTDADSLGYNEAKEALPFDGPVPKFQLRTSSSIFHNSASGKVKTNALTVHCDQKHVALLAPLFIKFYETGETDEKFVPHSLLHGNDQTYQTAYRNAIILQNKYLEVRTLPVIGISPKAMMKEKLPAGNAPPRNRPTPS